MTNVHDDDDVPPGGRLVPAQHVEEQALEVEGFQVLFKGRKVESGHGANVVIRRQKSVVKSGKSFEINELNNIAVSISVDKWWTRFMPLAWG